MRNEVPPRARQLREGRTLRVACFAERLRRPLRAPPRADSIRRWKEGSCLTDGYLVRKERLEKDTLHTELRHREPPPHHLPSRLPRAGRGQLLPFLPTCIGQLLARSSWFPHRTGSCVRRIILRKYRSSDVFPVHSSGRAEKTWSGLLARQILSFPFARKTFLACDLT